LLHSLKSVHIESTGNEHVGSSPVVGGAADHPIYDLNSVQSSFQVDGGIGNFKYPSPASAGSSPSGRLRTQGDINSPSWRSSSDFVQHSHDSQTEDPFVSPSHGRGHASSQGPQDTPSRRAKKDTSTPNTAAQPDTQDQDTGFPATPSFTPRQDRVGQEISVDNAQAVLPPLACVFVAK